MKMIDTELLDSLSGVARTNSRLRINHNFHDTLDDPINRILNAMEPGTYVIPHRHINPDINEVFLVLRGKIALFIFNDDGTVKDVFEISPDSAIKGIEIEPGVWHSLIVLEAGTILYEIKNGPYIPLASDNMASWAPRVEDREGINKYLNQLERLYVKKKKDAF